jgi:DNA-binding LacI/PurR family transcriptional regulator
MGKPTLADVAKRAGVSPTTAARVVQRRGYVGAEARAAVEAALRDLGYRPNLQARGLRTARSQTLGLIYSDETNPVFTKLSHAIRQKAAEAGYGVLSVDHDGAGRGEAGGIGQFLDHRVDVVIACHAHDPAAYLPLRKAGIPIIQIERMILAETHLVAYDPRPGLRAALAALHEAGHRRIGFIGGADVFADRVKPMVDIEEERATTFRAEAARLGLLPEDCPVLLGDYFRRDGAGGLPGETLVREMMAAHRPTALIAGSDVLAAGILQGLYLLGLSVPGDVSLVGYDDSIADLLAPPLTSVRQPYAQIAQAVMEIVAEAEGPLLRREVATRLVTRASIGPRKDP